MLDESSLLDKAWTFVVTAFGALLSFFMYHQKKVNDRLGTVERDLSEHKCNIEVIKTNLCDIKDDLNEIKENHKKVMRSLNKRS